MGGARSSLKQAVGELAREGYALLVAFEPEFTLGRRLPDPGGGPDRLVPIDDSLCYSSMGFDSAHDYALALLRALRAQGLQVEHYYPEHGHGQQEMTIPPAPAVRAADNHVVYRQTARGVAFRQGLWATFAPKPVPGQAGNGTHLHASLWELAEDGRPGRRNVLHDPGDPYGLSRVGFHFVGGLLAHLPALVALTCPSVNSYRRLVPQAHSSAYICYGMDNREAAVQGTTNLEFRPSDSSANPYLALGSYVHAGLDGIRNKIDPGGR